MQWDRFYILFYSLFFVLSFILKTLIQYKQTGINPYRFSKTISARQRFLQRYGKLIIIAWLLSVAVYSISRPLMENTGFPLFFNLPFLPYIALVISLISLVGLIAAQWQMGYTGGWVLMRNTGQSWLPVDFFAMSVIPYYLDDWWVYLCDSFLPRMFNCIPLASDSQRFLSADIR